MVDSLFNVTFETISVHPNNQLKVLNSEDLSYLDVQ